MITMNDIDVILSIPMSPVYTNALVLFNGKLLPTFVNLSKVVLNLTTDVSKMHSNEAILHFL